MSDRMFRELDQVFQDILDGVSPAGRTRTARKIGLAVRRSQQLRIASQKNPDGSGYAVRRRKVYCSQQGIKFFWNNEVRALKNWRGGRGKYPHLLPGRYRAVSGNQNAISYAFRDKKSTDVYPPAHPAFYEAQAGRGRRHRRI